MKKYYLHNGIEQQGPFDLEDLKTKNISRETSIWYEGLTEWAIAENIEELKPILSSIPPPFSSATLPPILNSAITQQQVHYEPIKEKNKTRKYIIIFTIILALCGGAICIAYINSNNRISYEDPEETYAEKVMTVEEIEKSQPNNFLKVDGKYNENFWGDKLKVHGRIVNRATVATYKDAVVKIVYYSKTNTEIGSEEYTIYENFSPNTTTNFELKIKNYSNVNSIGMEIVNATAL